MKKFPLEHSLWLLAIIVLFAIVLILPWFTAEMILPYIMIIFIVSLAILYIKSQRLYIEAHSHRNVLLKKMDGQSQHDKMVQNVIKHSPDGILVVNEAKQIEYISPKMEQLSGYKNKEVLGMKADLFQFVGIGEYPPLLETLFQNKKSAADKIIENKFVRKDGKEMTIEANCLLMPKEDHYQGIASIRAKE